MSPLMRIALGGMALAAVVSLLYFVDVAQRLRTAGSQDEQPGFAEADPPLYEPTDPPRRVRMFFPARSNDLLLRTRDMTIFDSPSPESRARQILEHLLEGAGDPLLFGRLPDGTRINHIFISADGIAYVDFNSALAENHPGGALPEQATVYAIVNSLAYNLPEIERVKILVGGIEKETLAGHTLLILPIEPDLAVSDMGPGEAI